MGDGDLLGGCGFGGVEVGGWGVGWGLYVWIIGTLVCKYLGCLLEYRVI